MSTTQKSGIVTGAGSGIGRAIVERLLADGHRIVAVDLSLKDVLSCGSDPAFLGHEGDVTDPATAARTVEVAAGQGWDIDFLVNAAGIAQPFMPLHDMTLADFQRVISVNLTGTFLMYQAAVRAMLVHGRGGSVINIASTAGIRPVSDAGGYVASKRAVIGLTETAALEVAKHNIRVNAVCPGVTDTPLFRASAGSGAVDQLQAMIPLRRIADVGMIADAVAWLIGDTATYVTGVTLPVDGGLQLV